MKIKVLGCSNSWTARATSCFLVNDNILLDCGLDAYKNYLKLDKALTDVKMFLITHFHADHIMGLYIFLTHYVEDVKTVTDKPKIVGLKGIKKFCEKIFEVCNLYKVNLSKYFDFIEVKGGEKLSLGNVEIEVFGFKHGYTNDVGYVLTEDNASFGYTGDVGEGNNLDPIINKCDICVIDVSGKNTTYTHLGVTDFLELLKKHPTKLLYATHCDEDVYTLKKLQNNVIKENDTFEIGIK